jgi:hypothetical protein
MENFMSISSLRFAIELGGTFTDVILLEQNFDSPRCVHWKQRRYRRFDMPNWTIKLSSCSSVAPRTSRLNNRFRDFRDGAYFQ